MEEKIYHLIGDVKSKFYLLIAIASFFPTVLYSFFQINAADQSNNIFLKASSLVIYYLISYIYFEVIKNRTSTKWIKWLDVLLLIAIASFILPLVFASSDIKTLTNFSAPLLIGGMGFQAGMTVVITSFVVFISLIGKNETK